MKTKNNSMRATSVRCNREFNFNSMSTDSFSVIILTCVFSVSFLSIRIFPALFGGYCSVCNFSEVTPNDFRRPVLHNRKLTLVPYESSFWKYVFKWTFGEDVLPVVSCRWIVSCKDESSFWRIFRCATDDICFPVFPSNLFSCALDELSWISSSHEALEDVRKCLYPFQLVRGVPKCTDGFSSDDSSFHCRWMVTCHW